MSRQSQRGAAAVGFGIPSRLLSGTYVSSEHENDPAKFIRYIHNATSRWSSSAGNWISSPS